MPALLLSPFARWGALAALVGALALWGWLERAGRQVAALEAAAARREAAGLRADLERVRTRNAVDDAVRREPSPVDRLRDEWSRD